MMYGGKDEKKIYLVCFVISSRKINLNSDFPLFWTMNDLWTQLSIAGSHLMAVPGQLVSVQGLANGTGFAVLSYIQTTVGRAAVNALSGLPMPEVTTAILRGMMTEANFIYAGCLHK